MCETTMVIFIYLTTQTLAEVPTTRTASTRGWLRRYTLLLVASKVMCPGGCGCGRLQLVTSLVWICSLVA